MCQYNEGISIKKPFNVFYTMTIVLLMGAVATTLVQKKCESAIARTAAMRAAFATKVTNEHQGETHHLIRDAEVWAIVGFTIVLLAILSWGIAIWRREKHPWAWVCVMLLLSLYILLEMTIV